jgi:hypothetical protein
MASYLCGKKYSVHNRSEQRSGLDDLVIKEVNACFQAQAMVILSTTSQDHRHGDDPICDAVAFLAGSRSISSLVV